MRHRLLKKFLLSLVASLVVAVGISFIGATATTGFHYDITDLGALNGYAYTDPFRINDLGQVVGWSRSNLVSLPSPSGRAFLWQEGTITNLGTLGGNSSRAFGLNNQRQTVGSSLTKNGLYHAFVWENGTMADLGTLKRDNSSVAVGINNSGQVIGWSYLASSSNPYIPISPYHAFLSQNGNMTDIGTLSGDDNSMAFAINNRGQVFGWSYKNASNSSGRIFKWQDGTMTNLGNLGTLSGYTSNLINGINNTGQVVGSSFSSSSGYKSAAFRWQNGILTDLGNLGGTVSEAIGINVAGTVVGYSYTSSSTPHAFIWKHGRLRDLNNFLLPNSGWELNVALGVNNKGQIVGFGKHNGQDHKGFILTPVTVSH